MFTTYERFEISNVNYALVKTIQAIHLNSPNRNPVLRVSTDYESLMRKRKPYPSISWTTIFLINAIINDSLINLYYL